MQILGYIVSEKRLKGIEGFVKQVKDYSEADITKPVLVIGWKEAETYPGYTTILNRKLNDLTFWTFKMTESRYEYEEDLEKFYSFIKERIMKNIKYYYVNVLTLKYSKLKKLYNILNSKDGHNIYINNGMLYIAYNKDVLGISLNVLEYVGIRKEKVLDKLKSNKKNKIVDNSTKGIWKLMKFFDNKAYAIPQVI